MHFKHIFITTLTFCLNISLMANTNASNKNDDNRPNWINTSDKDSLVAKGIALSLEEAKSRAESALKTMALNEAVNQMTTGNSYLKKIQLDTAKARQLLIKSMFYSNFDNKTHNTFYSEKIKNKETKAKEYHYYVLHVINTKELEQTINKFALDHEAETTFEYVNTQLPGSHRIKKLKDLKTKLMLLESKLDENSPQKIECNKLLAIIDDYLNNIQIAEMLNVPGKLIVCLTINNKAILDPEKPVVSAKSATIINIDRLEEKWIISYSPQKGSSTDVISVEFDNAGIKTTKDFTVDPNEDKVEVKLTGAAITIKNNRLIMFNVASTCREDVIIERLVLHYDEIHFTDTQLDQLLDGAGVYTISFLAPPDFNKIKENDIVYGELYFILKRTGKQEVYRFYNERVERRN